MKAFITKYSLTEGILEVNDAELCNVGNGSMIAVPSLGSFAIFHGEGKDWHKTLNAAINRANVMRLAKIASLKKSLAKMEKLEFTKPSNAKL